MIDGIWLKILLWAWAILLGAFAAMTGRDYFVAPILRIVDKCKEMRWPKTKCKMKNVKCKMGMLA